MSQAPSTFEAIDINSIASEANEDEIVKLTQMVLGCVVQSENNQQYIERITDKLEQSSQGVLMLMIQEVSQWEKKKKKKKISRQTSKIQEVDCELSVGQNNNNNNTKKKKRTRS